MQVSSILTPFRWYTDFYEQDRFTKDCKICPFRLITDKTRLLPFQFMRDKSPYKVDKFYLRKSCINYYNPINDTNDRLFIIDTGTWSKTRFTITNGYAKGTGGTTGQLQMSGLTASKNYSVKIIVSEVYKLTGESLTGEAYEGTNNLGSFYSPGTYIYNFTASSSTFKVNYASSNSGNYIVFEEITINEIVELGSDSGDIELDTDLITTCNAGDIDYLTYCGHVLDNQIPCGDYYAVIKTYDSIYFSEIIHVEDFIPSQSPYLLLEWWNDCDISDVVYQEHTCQYKNRLYIDGPLSKPEYPVKEEGEEDGNNTVNITFVKWEKQRTLTVPKAPEFICDAITALRLHNELYYTPALRKNQFKVGDSIQFEKAEHSLQPVFNECATNIELKLFLKDRVVNTNCCTNIAACECATCKYTIPEINNFNVDYGAALFLDDVAAGFYVYNTETDVWDTVTLATGVLICDESKGNGYWEYQPSNPNSASYYGFVWCPQLLNITSTGGDEFTVKGNIISASYGEIEYSTDGGSTWQTATPRFTPTQFQTPFTVHLSPTPCCGTFLARVRSFDINGCDYGTSPAIEGISPTNDCC